MFGGSKKLATSGAGAAGLSSLWEKRN